MKLLLSPCKLFAILLLIASLSACQKEVLYANRETELSKGALKATVVISDPILNNGIHDALIRVKNASTTLSLDINNSCQFKELAYVNELALVRYEHPETVPVQRIYKKNSPYINTDYVLLERNVTLAEFSSVNGGLINYQGAGMSVPANAFVLKSTGGPYTGMVKVTGSMGRNPTYGFGDKMVNGMTVYTNSQTGKKQYLAISYYANWKVTGANGEELELASGKQISFGRGVGSAEGQRIYYYNSDAQSYEEGSEEFQFGSVVRNTVNKLTPLIYAKPFPLAEVKARITCLQNRIIPGLEVNHYIDAGANQHQNRFNSLGDSNGYFHMYLPANVPLRREVLTAFNPISNPIAPEEISLPDQTYPEGVTDLGVISLDRTYQLASFEGTVVDSFMNPVHSGTITITYTNADPSIYNLHRGPTTFHYFSGPKFSSKVLVAEESYNTVFASYISSNYTYLGAVPASWSSSYCQYLTEPVNGKFKAGPIIDYNFSNINKKGVFYINNQRYECAFEKVKNTQVPTETMAFQFNCNNFYPTKLYAEVLVQTPISDLFQGEQKVTAIRFIIDDTDLTWDEWTATGDSKIIVYSAENFAVGNYLFPQKWYGIVKGTFKTANGETRDVKLLFNTGTP